MPADRGGQGGQADDGAPYIWQGCYEWALRQVCTAAVADPYKALRAADAAELALAEAAEAVDIAALIDERHTQCEPVYCQDWQLGPPYAPRGPWPYGDHKCFYVTADDDAVTPAPPG